MGSVTVAVLYRCALGSNGRGGIPPRPAGRSYFASLIALTSSMTAWSEVLIWSWTNLVTTSL